MSLGKTYPIFAKSNKSLLTYIEKNKSLDTKKIQNDRLTEYLKREQAIWKKMRDVFNRLNEYGYTKGLNNQITLDAFFGGTGVETKHLSFAFELNEAYFLSPARTKLNSAPNDITIAELANNMEDYVKNPRAYEV